MQLTTVPARRGSGERAPGPRSGLSGRAGYLFVSGYTVLLIAFGVLPAAYALWLALSNSRHQLVGLGNFTRTFADYRFASALGNVLLYVTVWLVSLTVLVLAAALMLHGRMPRTGKVLRFVYYVPGALAGAASVVLWLIMLDPAVSPAGFLLRAMGQDSLPTVILPEHLPVVFAVIAFWTGAGGWIIVMYGALNNIPAELLEAARMDGAGVLQTVLRIQLPMLRKWITYMVILAFAGGTQLFVEPQLVTTASQRMVSDSWSLNQLSLQYAFQADDFNGAAALSVDLLLIGVIAAAAVVFRGGLFERD
ncbi:carbohydrate ABC transporter permease [Streptomyces griseorubiginosus]|uniref:carbohydrate ABC transporter permease n=1 Tax=Streptomyces TaxID=1883 RepID=UPI0033DAC601